MAQKEGYTRLRRAAGGKMRIEARKDTRQKWPRVCHVRRGDGCSVRLKVCCLFEMGWNRYVTKLRYGVPWCDAFEGNEFLQRREIREKGGLYSRTRAVR